MNRSKAKVVISQITATIQMIVGIFFIFFAIVAGFGQDTIDSGDITLVAIFVLCGILLIMASVKQTNLIKAFRKYVSFLSSDETGSIESLALAAKMPENVVLSNLQKMIDKKYFPSAYIDLETRSIVFSNRPKNNTSNISREQPAVITDQDTVIVTATCKGCGGVNHGVKGSVGECEYCGSSLKFE
ncbi:MAG: hypothetical protein VB078_11570 [Clostridiaceae bacterium]|nr:hypothetical protein [Clostridiaceae bacterium]